MGKRRRNASANPLSDASLPWKTIDVSKNDAILSAAPEGEGVGFMYTLEELDPSQLPKDLQQKLQSIDDGKHTAPIDEPKSKKAKKSKKAVAEATDPQSKAQKGKKGKQSAQKSEGSIVKAGKVSDITSGEVVDSQKKEDRSNAKSKKKKGKKGKKVEAVEENEDDDVDDVEDNDAKISKILSSFNEECETSLSPKDLGAYRTWRSLGVAPALSKGLVTGLHFTSPTEIQSLSLPATVNGDRDILGAAETGSGKTLAFGIPIIQQIISELIKAESSPESSSTSDGPLRALILTPTRELALQVREHINALLKAAELEWVCSAAPVVGGIAAEKQFRLLWGYKSNVDRDSVDERKKKRGANIVVGTPGRLWDLISSGSFPSLLSTSFLVIDEADRMLQHGHFPELKRILNAVYAGRERERKGEKGGEEEGGEEEGEEKKKEKKAGKGLPQVFLYSATLGLSTHNRTRWKSSDAVKDARSHTYRNPKNGAGNNKWKSGKQHKKAKEETGENASKTEIIMESLLECLKFRNPKRGPKIVDITSRGDVSTNVSECYVRCPSLEAKDLRKMVFVNAIDTVKKLSTTLKLLNVEVYALHSAMQQRQRIKYLEKFAGADNAVLVTTDVSARGLDLPNVSYVIHYHTPHTTDVYVHRCGRCGRGRDSTGVSIALTGSQAELEAYIKHWIPLKAKNGQSGDVMQRMPKKFGKLDSLAYSMPAMERRANAARQLARAHRQLSIHTRETEWTRRNAAVMDILLEDSAETAEENAGNNARVKGGSGGEKGVGNKYVEEDELGVATRQRKQKGQMDLQKYQHLVEELHAAMQEDLVERGQNRQFFTFRPHMLKSGGAGNVETFTVAELIGQIGGVKGGKSKGKGKK